MNLLEFASFLRDNPGNSVASMADRVGCHQKNIQKFLAQLEVKKSRGVDPATGRKNVNLYEIRLPKEKQKAVSA